MDDKNRPQRHQRPMHIYDVWSIGVHEVIYLPPSRFYFAVTVCALVMIAYFLVRYSNDSLSGFVIAILVLRFGHTTFLKQWRRELKRRGQ